MDYLHSNGFLVVKLAWTILLRLKYTSLNEIKNNPLPKMQSHSCSSQILKPSFFAKVVYASNVPFLFSWHNFLETVS